MIKVFLVDDHGVVRAGLRHVLCLEPDIQVVGEAADGWKALDLLGRPELAVDVLVLDLSMPRLSGTEVLRRVLEIRPGLAVLIVSMYGEAQFASGLLAQGAAGYLSKDRADAEIVDAVRALARGRLYAARTLAAERGANRPAHESLSPREVQVFMLLIEGRTPTDIAAELDLGASTVSTHIAKIRTKLGVQNIAEIVTYAHRNGLID